MYICVCICLPLSSVYFHTHTYWFQQLRITLQNKPPALRLVQGFVVYSERVCTQIRLAPWSAMLMLSKLGGQRKRRNREGKARRSVECNGRTWQQVRSKLTWKNYQIMGCSALGLFRFELVIFVVFVPMFEVCCCVSVRREKEIN